MNHYFIFDLHYEQKMRVWLTEKTLEGELRCDRDLEFKYRVHEKHHAFVKIGDAFYRSNQIWQYKTRKCRSEVEEEKMITQNFALVKYQPQEWFDLSDVHKPK